MKVHIPNLKLKFGQVMEIYLMQFLTCLLIAQVSKSYQKFNIFIYHKILTKSLFSNDVHKNGSYINLNIS